MSRPHEANRVLAAAVRDVEKLEKRAKADGAGGIPLTEVLGRANRAAAQFLPEEEGRDSRVSRMFTPRSFRHYQTLGCIDPPERFGKRVVYGARHFVQALLVRRLLWERVPSERITVLMAGRSTEETKRMLFEGVEMVARAGGSGGGRALGSLAPEQAEMWKRIPVTPGAEIHLRDDLTMLRGAKLEELLLLVETVLRRNLR